MRDIWKGRTRGGDNLECLDSVEGGEVFALYDLAQSFVVDHEMISVLRSSMNDPVAYSVRGGKLTLDEYGAFEGVVTATDLLEMIAGDFDEGHDDQEAWIRQREDGSWLVDGQTDIDELADTLGEDFGEADGFHTIAGLVLHQLSRVPNEGEILQLGRFEVEIIDMDDRRIDKLMFKQLVKREDEADAVAAHLDH